MKSEQKETKTKMDDLEADTQKMQVKLTKKWKKMANSIKRRFFE
jgi:hypothetical protein